MDRFLKDYIQFTECFDKKNAILSPPQRTVSCENSIGQMEAVAQFSYSHRYKKRGKFVCRLPKVYKPSKFSLYFGLSKTVIFSFLLNLILTKTEKEFWGCRSTLKNRFWKQPVVQVSCNWPIHVSTLVCFVN